MHVGKTCLAAATYFPKIVTNRAAVHEPQPPDYLKNFVSSSQCGYLMCSYLYFVPDIVVWRNGGMLCYRVSTPDPSNRSGDAAEHIDKDLSAFLHGAVVFQDLKGRSFISAVESDIGTTLPACVYGLCFCLFRCLACVICVAREVGGGVDVMIEREREGERRWGSSEHLFVVSGFHGCADQAKNWGLKWCQSGMMLPTVS